MSLYNFKAITQQTVVAYISTITILLLIVGMITYHFVLLIDKDGISKVWQKNTGQSTEQPTQSKVTHSVIELPEPQQMTGGFELETIHDTKDHQIVTPPYQQ